MILTSTDTFDERGLTTINSRDVTIKSLKLEVTPYIREQVSKLTFHLMKVIVRQYRDMGYTLFTDVIQNQITAYET